MLRTPKLAWVAGPATRKKAALERGLLEPSRHARCREKLL